MNINDPFGRMQRRREQDYQSLCRSLKSGGITDRADAQALLVRLGKRRWFSLGMILLLTLLLALLLPDLRVVAVFLGGLAALWVVHASRRGSEFVQRYIDEELAGQDDNDSS